MNQQQQKNWWGRNWKWFVPVGCLGALALFAAGVALVMMLVFGMMKSSDVYKFALAETKAATAVQEIIGIPVEEGMFVSGNINVSGGSGQADISIPISGPGGKATIYVVAAKSSGQWIISTLIVEIEASGHRINLME
jgi:hypothetical protein